MSIAKDVEFIFKVSEEKSTLIASLDVGLKVQIRRQMSLGTYL